MSATMDIIVSAQDQASDVIEGVGETADQTGSWIEQNWGKVTAATAAAGAASEGFARSQADTNAVVARAGIVTGETDDSIRQMVDGMVDHTFSAHDAARGMEELMRRGIDTKDGFESILPVMDNFADATGKDIVDSIGTMDQVLGALGIPLEEAGDHVDQFTRLAMQTDVPLGTLERNLSRVAPELQDLGFDVRDAAAGIEVFRDRGLDGREATREFRRAVAESEGDMDKLLDNLGLTAEEFAEYQEKVGEAEGMTDQFAEANNNTMTPMERMQQNLENLMARYGGLAEAAGLAAPVLIAVGPAMKAMSMAAHGATAAVRALAAAKLTLLGPIALVVAAVAAVIAIGILVVKNWDEISAALVAAWEWVKDTAIAVWGAVRDWFVEVFDTIADFITETWDALTGWLSDTWASITATARAVFESVRNFFVNVFDAIRTAIVGAWNAITSFLSRTWNGIRDTARAIFNAIRDVITTVFNAYRTIITTVWNAISGFLTGIWDTIAGHAQRIWNNIQRLVTDPVGFARDTIMTIWNAVSGFLSSIWGGISSTASSVWNGIRTAITSPVTTARDFIIGAFETVRDRLAGVWDGITGGFSSAFGSLSNLARSPINAVIGVINSFIRRLNSISISIPDVPGVPGRGTNVGFNVSTIPRLAEGGIVRARPGGMLALIGEGGQDEAVVPLGPDDPFGALLAELRAVRRLLEQGGDVFLDRDKVGRALVRGMPSR